VAQAAAGRPVLREGDRGVWVKDAQGALNAIVGRNVLTEDGVFGPGTAKWVRQFQKDRGLKADGIVGQGTWQHLLSARLGR
jgi:peptidoglycan hydrolase-like protein with peptidoglycan-binding domain